APGSQGDRATAASWRGKGGTAAQPRQRAAATSRAPDRDSPRPREREPRGENLSRRGRNPLAKVFTPPHPPLGATQGRIEEGRGLFVRGVNLEDPGGHDSVSAPETSAPSSKGHVDSGGRNPARAGGDGSSGLDRPESGASPAVSQPAREIAAAAAATLGKVSSRTSSSRPLPSNDVTAGHARTSDENTITHSASAGEEEPVGKGGWPSAHSSPVDISARDRRSGQAGGSGGQGVILPDGAARFSSQASAPDIDRCRATASSSVRPGSTPLLPTRSSASGSTVAGSSDPTKSKSKQSKKAKVVERKAAERRAAAAAAAAAVAASVAPTAELAGEEPTWSCSNAPAANASPPPSSESEPSHVRQRHPRGAYPPATTAVCSSAQSQGVVRVGDVSAGAGAEVSPIPVPVRPGSRSGKSTWREETTASIRDPDSSHRYDASSSITWSSSSRGRVPDSSATKDAAGVQSASNGGRNVVRPAPVPGSANGGWTREGARRGPGRAGKNGVAAAHEKASHAAAGGRAAVGHDGGTPGESRQPPPLGRACERGGADVQRGGASAAVVGAPAV
ncbi:unnamed protein product, partial [Scytosiphon promiscuus]